MELKRVVITGLGAITPIGNNVPETWEGLKNGVSGADLITRFDSSNFKTKFACEVKDYNVLDHFDRKEARKLDQYAQFGIIAAREAVKDAGIDKDTFESPFDIGVIWSSGIGGLKSFMDEMESFFPRRDNPKFNPFFIPKMIPDIAAGHISIEHGFCGPNYGTVSACASSTHSLIDAFNLIRLGRAKAFVAGGSEAAVNEGGVGGFSAMHALSTRNDDPKTASRPFDKDRDGFVIGEGGVALILEELDHALARGAKIYGEVVGSGMSGDAHHITAPHPEGIGAARVMSQAVEEAGISPEDVDYVNVHGTSTGLGDVAEPKAIQSVFGEHSKSMSISSTKSMTGHLLGAAGAMEALASVLAIQNDIVPPTINHFNDDPNVLPLDYTFNKAKKREINYALSNTFGFGGHNASILMKKYK